MQRCFFAHSADCLSLATLVCCRFGLSATLFGSFELWLATLILCTLGLATSISGRVDETFATLKVGTESIVSAAFALLARGLAVLIHIDAHWIHCTLSLSTNHAGRSDEAFATLRVGASSLWAILVSMTCVRSRSSHASPAAMTQNWT